MYNTLTDPGKQLSMPETRWSTRHAPLLTSQRFSLYLSFLRPHSPFFASQWGGHRRGQKHISTETERETESSGTKEDIDILAKVQNQDPNLRQWVLAETLKLR